MQSVGVGVGMHKSTPWAFRDSANISVDKIIPVRFIAFILPCYAPFCKFYFPSRMFSAAVRASKSTRSFISFPL